MNTIPLFSQFGPAPNFVAHVGASSIWVQVLTNVATETTLAIYDDHATASDYMSDVDSRPIVDLHEDGYVVLRPIPIKIERVNEGGFLATFSEANIAIGGLDYQDAYQSLVAEILDTFDTLTEEEERLSPDAAAQLQVLRTYIGQA